MKVKPEYFDYKTAPMVFFFVVRVAVIAILAYRIGLFYLSIKSDGITALSGSLDVISILVLICVLIGMWARLWIGPVFLLVSYMLTIVDAIAAIIICINLGVTNMYSNLAGRITGAGVMAIICWVYFCKRRMLFKPLPKDSQKYSDHNDQKEHSLADASNDVVSKTQEKAAVENLVSDERIVYNPFEKVSITNPEEKRGSLKCNNCEKIIPVDSLFCPHCGNKKIDSIMTEPKEAGRSKGRSHATAVLGVLCFVMGAVIIGLLIKAKVVSSYDVRRLPSYTSYGFASEDLYAENSVIFMNKGETKDISIYKGDSFSDELRFSYPDSGIIEADIKSNAYELKKIEVQGLKKGIERITFSCKNRKFNIMIVVV